MAYTTVNKSTDYQSTKLYDGTGASNAITGIGFQPDWVWIKNRVQTYWHQKYDAARGVNKSIASNVNNAQENRTDNLNSFDTDGFTVGAEGGDRNVNYSGDTYVAWNWKAGTTSIPTGSTSDPSAVSINTTSGFGIYKITAPGSGNYVLKHGLGATPAMVIVKRTDGTQGWMVWHKSFSNATDDYIQFNTDAAKGTYSSCWGTMNSTDCTIATGGTLDVNAEHIIYVFTEVTGYSKFGKYVANDQDGYKSPFIYTGFKPRFIIFKNISSTANWIITDDKRRIYNPTNKKLYPNDNSAEVSDEIANLLSNGFKLDNSTGDLNAAAYEYIYMAFGQTLVGTNNVPCTGW
jgi:hypothetical protein